MLLIAGSTALEVRSDAWNRSGSVGAGQFELHVIVEPREALHAAELEAAGSEEELEGALPGRARHQRPPARDPSSGLIPS